jgi:diaminohydroxyphosphoribosylaminopyrimidine deaminase/5-amino-6-(5-phosphoribosylamino)uracil reductase
MRAQDEQWMRRALVLARMGEGLTRPNPAVGAVVVRGGRMVGEGYHRKAGGPHAEVVALRKAGARARGATLYVTLEPCSTWGRTPPCTEAILAAGVRRVVIGVTDPNPKHAGRGLDILRKRGVAVTCGICQAEAAEVLAPFATHMLHQRPRVILKLGMTMDGRLADPKGRSRWITGTAARQQVHALRRRSDAILVGRGTAELDNPSLLPVPSGGRRPWRIVLDRRGVLSPRNKIFTDGHPAQTLVVIGCDVSARYRAALKRRGVELLECPTDRTGFRLDALLKCLGKRGVLQVLCEGGGTLAGSLLRRNLVDEAWLFMAPRLLGDQARPAVAGARWRLDELPTLRITGATMVGEDVLIKAVRREF